MEPVYIGGSLAVLCLAGNNHAPRVFLNYGRDGRACSVLSLYRNFRIFILHFGYPRLECELLNCRGCRLLRLYRRTGY